METAFITGASEGMGYEFACQFANKGINLILAARNDVRLKTISDEFSRLGVNVLYYARDLSIPDNARFIFEDLKAKNIRVQYLINNAGFGINGNYTDIEWDRELEMFNLNMLTLAYFTKMFAREMKANGFGRILNVGSTGSFQPGPFMAGYCASKAFVLSLSEAVNYELRGTDVKVSTLCPGVTDTRFHTQAQTGSTVMSKFLAHAKPGEVAEYGIKLMLKGKSMGIYGLSNKMIVTSNRLACRNMSTAIAGKMLKSDKKVLER